MANRFGTNANDVLDFRALTEFVTVHAYDGNDRVWGTAFADFIFGGGGNDTLLEGEDGNDWIDGGTGNDHLEGGEGDDTLWGGAGADAMYGEDGDDVMIGGVGNDFAFGGYDDDWLWGDEGDDRLEGSDGDDVVDGGAGNDLLFGDSGYGSPWSGDDQLAGGDGNDEIHGGFGDDVIAGGRGRDTLYGDATASFPLDGNTGADVFVFAAADIVTRQRFGLSCETYETDVVLDFGLSADRLDLSSLLDAATSFAGVTAAEARAQGYLYWVQHGQPGQAGFGTTIYVDRNGGPFDTFATPDLAVADLAGIAADQLNNGHFIV